MVTCLFLSEDEPNFKICSLLAFGELLDDILDDTLGLRLSESLSATQLQTTNHFTGVPLSIGFTDVHPFLGVRSINLSEAGRCSV